MAHKPHVVLIVPDGVGIKNFLYSSLLKYLDKHANITIWSTLPEKAFIEVKEVHDGISLNYKQLKLFKESVLTRLFREASTYSRLHYFSTKTENETLLLNWRKPKGKLKSKILYSLAQWLGSWAKSDYNRILKLENLSKKYWSKRILEYYKTELKNLKADSIFITHQRVSGLMPICMASEELNINSTSAIFSWDNLPKARLCVDTNYYALWSEWMLKDMILFYPEIEPTQLKVVGTPQFEFYTQKSRIVDRAQFAKKYKLDHNKIWICFSGDDELTSPYDPNYLRDIAKQVSKNFNDVQLIFRRCPVDFSDRYDTVLNEFNDIIVSIDPVWHTDSNSWVGYFSKYEDINLQVNLAHHCVGVINLGSTMALDFAALGKPCYYLNYDTVIDSKWSTNFIYKYHHFDTLEGLDPVGWINKIEDILPAISSLVDVSETVNPDSKKWMERIVLNPIDKNAERLSKILI